MRSGGGSCFACTFNNGFKQDIACHHLNHCRECVVLNHAAAVQAFEDAATPPTSPGSTKARLYLSSARRRNSRSWEAVMRQVLDTTSSPASASCFPRDKVGQVSASQHESGQVSTSGHEAARVSTRQRNERRVELRERW